MENLISNSQTTETTATEQPTPQTRHTGSASAPHATSAVPSSQTRASRSPQPPTPTAIASLPVTQEMYQPPLPTPMMRPPPPATPPAVHHPHITIQTLSNVLTPRPHPPASRPQLQVTHPASSVFPTPVRRHQSAPSMSAHNRPTIDPTAVAEPFQAQTTRSMPTTFTQQHSAPSSGRPPHPPPTMWSCRSTTRPPQTAASVLLSGTTASNLTRPQQSTRCLQRPSTRPPTVLHPTPMTVLFQQDPPSQPMMTTTPTSTTRLPLTECPQTPSVTTLQPRTSLSALPPVTTRPNPEPHPNNRC